MLLARNRAALEVLVEELQQRNLFEKEFDAVVRPHICDEDRPNFDASGDQDFTPAPAMAV